MKEKHYASIDELMAEIAGIPIEELAEPTEDGRHLISRDELLAAGALDVPPAWRKSLRVERESFPLFDDDDELPEQQDPSPPDTDDDESAD